MRATLAREYLLVESGAALADAELDALMERCGAVAVLAAGPEFCARIYLGAPAGNRLWEELGR